MRWKTRKNVKSSCMLSRPNWNQILIKRFSRNCKKFCWLVNRCLTNVRRSTRNPYSRNLNNAKGKLTRCRKITARLWWASTDGYFWDMLYSLFISMYISDRAQNWICEARGFGRGQACWSYARLTACTCRQGSRSRFNTAAGEQSPIITAPVLGSRTAETTSGKGSVVLPMTRAKLTGGVSHLVLRHYTCLKNSSYYPLGMSAVLLSAHDHDTRLVMSKRCKLHRLKKRRTN